MGVNVAVAVAVGAGVGVNVGVAVGVGVPQATVAVSCWPLLTGGDCPPVGSQAYWVKSVLSFFTPTTKAPLFAVPSNCTEL